MRLMAHFPCFFFLCIFVSCSGISGESSIKEQQKTFVEKVQDDQVGILIRFRPGTGKDAIKKIQDKYNLGIIKSMTIPGLLLMKNNGDTPLDKLIIELKKYDEVMYAEPDYKYRIDNK